MTTRRQSRGVVLMGLMVLLALAGLALLNFSESAATVAQRERETQLLWVGQQYRRAIESYYLASPGPAKHLPVSLDELLRDSRFPQPVRHIRRLYADPLQPAVPWGLVRRGNQILGIYSQSDGQPLRRVNLGPGLEALELAGSYADWRFTFVPRAAAGAPPVVPAPSSPSHPLPGSSQP